MDYKKSKKSKGSKDEAIISFLKENLKDSIKNTGEYSVKQERFYRLRMRMRDKKKTYPFDGASDLRQPTADIKIRKAKAAVHNLIFGVRPVVQAIHGPGGTPEKAHKIEKFLDHLIMDVMKASNKCLIAIDQTFEKGMYFIKPYWKTESTTRLEVLNATDFSVEEITMMVDPEVPDEMKIEALKAQLEVDMSDRVANDNDEALEGILEKIKNGDTEISTPGTRFMMCPTSASSLQSFFTSQQTRASTFRMPSFSVTNTVFLLELLRQIRTRAGKSMMLRN
jgi:hypothetical protein